MRKKVAFFNVIGQKGEVHRAKKENSLSGLNPIRLRAILDKEEVFTLQKQRSAGGESFFLTGNLGLNYAEWVRQLSGRYGKSLPS